MQQVGRGIAAQYELDIYICYRHLGLYGVCGVCYIKSKI